MGGVNRDPIGELEGVAAILLHGSLATGSFFRPKSDVDLLVVVEHALSDSTRRSLAVDLVELFHRRPILGGIEVSAVTRLSLEFLPHPMPYEFHFSEKWVDDVQDGGSGPEEAMPTWPRIARWHVPVVLRSSAHRQPR